MVSSSGGLRPRLNTFVPSGLNGWIHSMAELKDILAKSPTKDFDALQVMADAKWIKYRLRFAKYSLLIPCYIFAFTGCMVWYTEGLKSLAITGIIIITLLFLIYAFRPLRDTNAENQYVLIEKNGTIWINTPNIYFHLGLSSKCIKPDENGIVQIEKSPNGKCLWLKTPKQKKPKYHLLVKAYPNLECQYKEFMDEFFDPHYVGLKSFFQDKQCVNLHILRIAQTPEYVWWACGPMKK